MNTFSQMPRIPHTASMLLVTHDLHSDRKKLAERVCFLISVCVTVNKREFVIIIGRCSHFYGIKILRNQ